MATIVNEIDTTLQAAGTRTTNTANSDLTLIASAPMFHIAADGSHTPDVITIKARLTDLDGPVEFTAQAATLSNVTAMSADVEFANVTDTAIIITGSVTSSGEQFTNACMLTISRDGTDGADGNDGAEGPRGAGWFYATGTVWSDVAAQMACPGGPVLDDQVTISSGNTFASTKRWTGTAWFVPGAHLTGDLFVDESIHAAAIDTRGLRIQSSGGTVIIGDGVPLQPGYEAAGTKNAELAPSIPIDLVLVGRGCSVTGNTITMTGYSSDGANADCYSADSYAGGAFMSAIAAQSNVNLFFGLNTDPTTDAQYNGIDFAIYLRADGQIAIYESGVGGATYGMYYAGDMFAVTYDGATIRYLHEGVVIRTVPVAIAAPMFFDSSFSSLGSSLKNVRFGPMTGLSSIAMDADGSLIGAGGGKVTIGGLGYLGDLNATHGADASNFTGTVGGDNLAKNSSFEKSTNGLATGWDIYNNDPASEPATAYIGAGRTGGAGQGIRWATSNFANKGIRTSVPGGGMSAAWLPNTTYTISFYARGVVGAPTCFLGWNTHPADAVEVANPVMAGQGFHRFIFKITWGDTVENNGALFISASNGPGAGDVIFDDLMVIEGDVTPAYAPSASEAGALADAAQASAAAVTANVAKITDDGYLSRDEKPGVVLDWQNVDSERNALLGQADALAVNRDAYENAYQALSAYLTSLNPSWSDATQDTVINRAAYRDKWNTYEAQKAYLATAIAAKSATLANSDANIRTPGGGTMIRTDGSVVGAIKIRLPQSWTPTMVKFTVDIFEFEAGYSCTLEVAGYMYGGPSSNVWERVSARVSGSSNVEYPVYFGHDGTKCCVWIGNASETWTFPQVFVHDVFCGYQSYDVARWATGWQVSMDGAAATSVSAQVLDTYPGADWAKIPKRAGVPEDNATYLPPGRGTAINDDPTIEKPSAWLIPPGVTIYGGAGAPAACDKYFGVSGGAINAQVSSARRHALDPNRAYYLSAMLYAAGGNDRNMYLFVNFYDANGAQITGTGWGGAMSGYVFGGLPPTDVWARQGNQFGAGTSRPIPSNARTCDIGIWFQYNNGSNYVLQGCQDIRLEAVMSANHLDANLTSTLNDKLSKSVASILNAPVTLSTSGAIKVGDVVWDGVNASGTGVISSPNGIALVQGGVVKVVIPVSGEPIFAGRLQAAYGDFLGNVIAGPAGGFRVEMGPDDPTYALWVGTGAKTDANAVFYLKRSGAGYFGGSLSAGTLKTSVSNPSIAYNADVTDGPFGSNGHPINVVVSLDYHHAKSSTLYHYSVDSTPPQATVQLYLGSTLVQTATFSGSYSIDNGPAGDPSSYQCNISGSFTYTDSSGSTADRTFRAVITNRQEPGITTSTNWSGGSNSADTFYQRLGITTTEQ